MIEVRKMTKKRTKVKRMAMIFMCMLVGVVGYQLAEIPYEKTYIYYDQSLIYQHNLETDILLRGGEKIIFFENPHGFIESGRVASIEFVANPIELKWIKQSLPIRPVLVEGSWNANQQAIQSEYDKWEYKE